MSLMERFADPELFTTLDMGEKSAATLITTLMGMGTTLLVLVLIWLIIVLMSEAIKAVHREDAAPQAASPAMIQVAGMETEEEDTDEIVAAVVAALLLSERNKSQVDLVLKKIERVRR